MNKPPTLEEQIAHLLDIIQQGMTQKMLNTAALAKSIEMERKELKRILTGQKDITVREFISISSALNLDATMFEEHKRDSASSNSEEMQTPSMTLETGDRPSQWVPETLGNHTRQLIAYGFALGCNMILLCNVNLLKNSNIPEDVIARFRTQLPIQLDAEYHPYNKPHYHDEFLELRLSFDALYTCYLPWNSIHQVVFKPDMDPEIDSPPDGPNLRLV